MGKAKTETEPKKKKRGQGEGSIFYIKSKKLWCSKATIGRDENGKPKRKAFYGKTRDEVNKKLIAALNDVNNDTYIEPSKMTVAQWMDTWLKEYKERTVKHATYYRLCSTTESHIKPQLGHFKLVDLRNDTIQKFTNSLVDKGYCAKHIKNIVTTLKAALEQAWINGIIIKNPATKIIFPQGKKADIRILTPEEQERFIETAKVIEYGEIFIVALGTGLRIGELLALTWDNINFENNTLTVNKTLHSIRDYYNKEFESYYELGTPKTKSSYRTIPLLQSLIPILDDIKRQQEINKAQWGCAYSSQNLVFCNNMGVPARGTVYSRFKIICGIADIEGVHVHCLRHTFASRGLENGIDLKVMQEFLGHSSISETANTYTHVLSDVKKDSIQKLEDTIKL